MLFQRGCFQHRLVYDDCEINPPGARLLDQSNRCRRGVFGSAEESGAESDLFGYALHRGIPDEFNMCAVWPNCVTAR